MPYKKQGFTDGMILQARHLTAMEDAILELEKKGGQIDTDGLVDLVINKLPTAEENSF